LNIKSSKKKSHFTILVLGGSQGAKIFSTKITEALIACSKTHKNLRVIQQVINSDIESVQTRYSENSITAEIKSFFKDIEEKYIEADLIIARSGASTIAEIIALKKPAILIPMPGSADNHQYFNAKLLKDESASILLEQKNIESDLENILNKILEDKSKLISMQDALQTLQINGTQILFHAIRKLFH
jgi:UDP-N-acetylglucosamine--N-acetylmuramyl-(pentapeptide) pyrophosphoryl-undecaprenol N-acetylglucosamine transferase